MVKFAPLALSKIIETVAGTVLTDSLGGSFSREFTELGEPLEVGADGVTFIISEAFIKDVAQTKASVVIIQTAFAERVLSQLPPTVKACIGCPDAYVGLAHLTKVIADTDPHLDWRLASLGTAAIHPTARVDETARIGAGVVIGEGAKIGPRTMLLANVVVDPK